MWKQLFRPLWAGNEARLNAKIVGCRLTVFLTILALLSGVLWQNRREATRDPAKRAQMATQSVRKVGEQLGKRLELLEVSFQKQPFQVTPAAAVKAEDLSLTLKSVKEMGAWLLQQYPTIGDDMNRYIELLQAASPRVIEAASMYQGLAKQYQGGSQFHTQYLEMEATSLATARAIKTKIAELRVQQSKLQEERKYIEDCLAYIDRLEVYAGIMAINNSEEARRVEQYLTVLNSFREKFRSAIRSVGKLDIPAEAPTAPSKSNDATT